FEPSLTFAASRIEIADKRRLYEIGRTRSKIQGRAWQRRAKPWKYGARFNAAGTLLRDRTAWLTKQSKCEPVSGRISLISGKNTGKFARMMPGAWLWRPNRCANSKPC